MNLRNLVLSLAFLGSTFAVAAVPASAQVMAPAYQGYHSWQAEWDNYQFDRHHVILGRVASFEPFRLQVAKRDGVVQTIDLKNGTVILPTGETPATNARVAIVGYYSHGTFIANRIILRT